MGLSTCRVILSSLNSGNVNATRILSVRLIELKYYFLIMKILVLVRALVLIILNIIIKSRLADKNEKQNFI